MANTVKRLFLQIYPEMYYSIHTYQSTESTNSLERRKIPVQKWNTMCILASSYQYYFLQTVLGYIAFEKQIQQHFSKCESYLREREREGARREFDVPPSLTDT